MSSWIESFAIYTFIYLPNNILSIVFLPEIFIWLLITNKYLLEKNLPKHFCDTLFFLPEFTGQMVYYMQLHLKLIYIVEKTLDVSVTYQEVTSISSC